MDRSRLYPSSRVRQSAFTLVELVLVIVLLGIIAAASTQFVGQSVDIYTTSVERDRLQQEGRFAVERMTRELRNALPGSVRVSSSGGTQCIEFMPVKAASTYLQPVAGAALTSLSVVDFPYTYTSGDLLAIYPIDANSVYVSSSALATLTGASAAAANQRTLSFNSHSFPNESPTRRLFIVNDAVSFCAADNALTRHAGYGLSATQAVPPANSILLAQNIRVVDGGVPVTVFDFTAGTPARSGVVHLDLRFSNAAQDEWMRFNQEVFLRNTP